MQRRMGDPPLPATATLRLTCTAACTAPPRRELQGVQDSEALRKAVEEVQPENVKLGLRLSQSR